MEIRNNTIVNLAIIHSHIFQSVLDVSTHFVKQDLYCLTKKHDGGQFFSNLDLFIDGHI
mgnify:CR=1 FL=1